MKRILRPPELRKEEQRVLEAISNPERYRVMLTLKEHNEGLSFSQLAKIFAANHNALDRHLRVLALATLVWNFYERREGKDHSFYKLSTLGERLIDTLEPQLETAGQTTHMLHPNVPLAT